MLGNVFGLKRDKITGNRGEGGLYSENLHDLYSSPHVIRMTKSRRMRWGGRVAEEERRIKFVGGETEGPETT
jgi:hypothetical protein